MHFDEILPASFFQREAHDLACALLGHFVVSEVDDTLTAGRIVEVEVYGGVDDPACHADRGTPTERTRSMYGEPGTAYIYRIYGMYDCLNVVAPRGPTEKASAILVRALEPVHGLRKMADRRDIEQGGEQELLRRDRWKLLSGPGKLCQALAVDRSIDGDDLQSHPLWIARGVPIGADEVATSARIGLNRNTCGDSTDFPWRYVVRGSEYLSRKL